MRAGLSTIQQTLTPEAATVLNQSIAEATRRNHGQTTPLHVAATLLSSPSGFLRQACIRSHPNSSHPLQCRALELCFSVALERLPTAQNAEPPISNALMAALKRAQAHQRRGCPEQQQQPLLAIKVELEQLIISILDDPSVSRVMREASFSSPAVKAAVEQSLNNSNDVSTSSVSFGSGFGPRLLSNPGQLTTPAAQTPATVNRSMHLNPRLQQGGVAQIGNSRCEESPVARSPSPAVPSTGNRNMYLNPRLQQGAIGQIGNSRCEETPLDQPQSPALTLTGNRNMYLNPRLQIGNPRGEETTSSLNPPSSANRNMYLNPRLQQGSTAPIGNPRLQETLAARTPSPAVPLAGGNQNMYLNPRLQQGPAGVTGNPRGEDVKKVFDIMSRRKKRNPILVGDSEPDAVIKELFRKIENKEFGNDVNLKKVQVISMEKGLLSDKDQIATKMDELAKTMESRIKNGGVILDLGDLKWLVEQPSASFVGAQQQPKTPVVSEMGRMAVAEMSKLLARFSGGDESGNGNESDNNLWLIGTATCETYLRCQVYHSTVENDWDLQAVPITSRSPLPGMFPRLGTDRILSNTMGSFNPLKAIPTPLPALTSHISENLDPASFCPQCSGNYEKEVGRLAAIEKSFSEAKQDTARPSLPLWLQKAKLNDKTTDDSQGNISKQKTQELQKKWRDTCLHLHPNFHQKSGPSPTLSMPTLYNPSLLARPNPQPKLMMSKPHGATLQLNTNQISTQTCRLSPPSPVQTDLVLGTKNQDDDQAKDLLNSISSEPQSKILEKFSNAFDADTYKKLLRGLMEKAWWQAEAASAVASAVTRCRLGNGKQRGTGSRGDVWLLFTGPDRVGKKKMAAVLAEQICGANPVIICLGAKKGDDDSDSSFRGKTAVDRIAEAIRRNPCSVIMLSDIDEADMIIRGNVKRAMERGRLTDSHGREVGLGNAIFVVTGDWSTVNPEGRFVDEKKLESTASGSWQLGLIVREKSSKRKGNWSSEESKRRRLDLNLAAGVYSEELEEDEVVSVVDGCFSIGSVPHELVSNVDDSIVFKPVDCGFVRREIKKTISVKFEMVVDKSLGIEIGDDVLEKILGGLWHDRTSLTEWVENVVGPSLEELKPRLPAGDRSNSVVRLVVESDSCDRGKGDEDWLPSSILV